jgi:uncharacterized repeat protein (TIGR03803 family)
MIRTSSHCPSTLAVLVLAVVVVTVPAQAQSFSVLYNFGTNTGDPANPFFSGIIAQGRDGNLYSTAIGGANGAGAVFKVTPGGTLTVLYSFTGGNDGSSPNAGLTLGTDGNFYGAATNGGASGKGTIFKVTPGGTLTPLYSFTGGADGENPYAPPIQGIDGNFYGTTSAGGGKTVCAPNGCGTVYKITPSGTFTTLYQFDIKTGFSPFAPLIQGTDGNFYGTTNIGGNNGTQAGVVFKITAAGKLTVIYNFDNVHGSRPFGSLVQGSDGNFYGTTSGGGTQNGGVVFKITATGKLTVLYNINGTTDGGDPRAGLVQATDGNFYGANLGAGASSSGCPSGCGTVFKITPTGAFSVLYNFDRTTGDLPYTTLYQHTGGLLYGTTQMGGTGSVHPCSPGQCGVLYNLNIGAAPFVSLMSTSGKVGKTVEILGQGFTGATGVSFGGTPATTFTVSSDTYLTATVPAGALTGSVTVTTPGGTLTSNRTFRVIPQIKSFSPTSGPVGTSVVITGVSLTQTTAVTFGGVKATSFTVNSDIQVTATVPTGAKTGKIAITTLGGTATSSTTFTVTVACAPGVTVEQVFTSSVHGCAGKGVHSNLSSLCASGWHACSATEWVGKFGGVPPPHDYWTVDTLWYSPPNATTNNCAVAAAGTTGFSSCVAPNGPSMLVCSSSQPDPEGNSCNITGCGLNSTTPSEFFGGCPKTDSAGTVCCSP